MKDGLLPPRLLRFAVPKPASAPIFSSLFFFFVFLLVGQTVEDRRQRHGCMNDQTTMMRTRPGALTPRRPKK